MMSSSSSSIHVPLGQAFHLVPARPSTSTSPTPMDASSSAQPHQVMTFFGSASMPALYTSAPIVIPKPLGAMRRASMSSSPTSSPPNRYLFATLPSSSSSSAVASTSPMSRSPISSPHSSPRSSPIPIPITKRKFNIKLQSQEPMTTTSSSSSSSTSSHQIQAPPAPILIDDTSDAQTKTKPTTSASTSTATTPASPSLQEQVASLPAPNVDWVWRLTLSQLQTEMRERGLHVRGRKVECIHRLITDIRLKHFAGQSLEGSSTKTTSANRSTPTKSITISETTSSPTQAAQPEIEEAEPATTTTVSSPVAMVAEQQAAEPKGSNAWRKRKRDIESLKDKIEKQQGDAKIWLRRPLAPGGITDDEIVHWIRTTPKAGIRRIRLTYKIGYRKARRLLDRALQEAETERGLSSSSEADSLRSGSSDSDSETSESVSSSSSSSRLSGSEGRKKPKLDDKNDSGDEEEGAKELCSMASWQQITEYGHLVDTLHLTPAEIQVKSILFPDNAIRVNTGRSGRKLPTWPSRPLPSVHIRNDVDTEMTSSDGELPEEPSTANGGIRSVLHERLALTAIKEPLHPIPRHSKPQPMEPSLGALGVGITKTWEALVQEKVNPGRRASTSSSSSGRRASSMEISGSLLDALDPTVKSTVEREASKFLEGFLGHMFAGVASQKKADEENKENTQKNSTNGVADAQTVLSIARELEELPTAVAKRVEQRLQPIYG